MVASLPVEPTIRDGVLQLARPATEWLSTGVDGGRHTADAVYNITVPTGWAETDISPYVADRLAGAGFEEGGPALLTGVAQRHARVAVCEPVCVVVTAGLSNPATLPPRDDDDADESLAADAADSPTDDRTGFRLGTINVLAVTTRSLPPGALATLLTVLTEAKTATLLARTGFSGTTSDAVVVGCDPTGDYAPFSGSSTTVGRAARLCVRDALTAALDARYATDSIPDAVGEARYGCVTTGETRVSRFG